MKKLSSLLLGMVIAVTSFAQVTPDAGDFGFSFRVTGIDNIAFTNQNHSLLSGANYSDPSGIIGSINTIDDLVSQQMFSGKYMVNADLALRMGLGINTFRGEGSSSSMDTSGTTTVSQKVEARTFGIMLGIEKHIEAVAARLDPYVGLQMQLGTIGDVDFEQLTTNANNTVSRVAGSFQGGYAFGIDAFGGFNYFLTDNVAIGAEFSWGYHIVDLGGNYNINNGANVTNGNYSNKTQGFRVGSTSGINFNIYF